MSDDDFMDVINNGGASDIQDDSELFNMDLTDLVRGIRNLSECIMLLSDFVSTWVSIEEELETDEDFSPQMPITAVMYAKQMFDIADKFSYALMSDYDDDDDDDVRYYLEPDDDEDEDGE